MTFNYPHGEDYFADLNRQFDVVITHGPPKIVLDKCIGGYVGCPSLARALAVAKPKLHCFGHIHEGYGTTAIDWSCQKMQGSPMCLMFNGVRYIWAPTDTSATLEVNASIINDEHRPCNAPFAVTLDCPGFESICS